MLDVGYWILVKLSGLVTDNLLLAQLTAFSRAGNSFFMDRGRMEKKSRKKTNVNTSGRKTRVKKDQGKNQKKAPPKKFIVYVSSHYLE